MRFSLFFTLIALMPYAVYSHGGRPVARVKTLEGWRSDFKACRDEALGKNRPFVLVWGHDMCPHCKALAADLSTNETFKLWRQSSDYVFCHVTGRRGKISKEIKLAKTFAATAGGTVTYQPSSYPYVCVYHKKGDGTVVARSFTTQSAAAVMDIAQKAFSEVPSSIPSRDETVKKAAEITPQSFCGSYTAQLPFVNAISNASVRGDASLALHVLPDRDGVGLPSINYSATLPDGSGFSGAAPFKMEEVVDGTGATSKVLRVDIVGRAEGGELKVPLKIKPFAAESWKNPSAPEGLPSVFLADGAKAEYRSMSDSEAHELAIYGGFYRRGQSLKQLCTLFDLSPKMSLKVRAGGTVSERFGEVLAWPSCKIVAGGKTFAPAKKKLPVALAYLPANGTISGRVPIPFANKTIVGELKGVVLPGWIDCHCGTKFTPRPFASGLLAYKDFVKKGTNWVEVTRSVPFEIRAK